MSRMQQASLALAFVACGCYYGSITDVVGRPWWILAAGVFSAGAIVAIRRVVQQAWRAQ